ncbi:hypothetical protein AAEJ42_01975 [Shewanella algae]|uniref:hypothetical protein n=1 Tax=Shewanella algae TaxID=38313 RepID=UPI00313DBF87
MDFNIDFEDFLGPAAKAKHAAKDAIREGRYDDAWKQLHIQKENYLKNSSRHGFTKIQTLSLDADPHEDFANILRLEKKHNDAFVNILYWVSAQSHRPKKSHASKLKSYFNRTSFKNSVSFDEVEGFIESRVGKLNTYVVCQRKVKEWLSAKEK